MNQDRPETGPARHAQGDAALEPFFEAARLDVRRAGDQAADGLPGALSARLMADALAAMPAKGVAAARPRSGPGGIGARFHGFLEALGGGMGLAAASLAGVAGLWLGLAEPEPAAVLVEQVWMGAGRVSPALAGWAEDPLDAFDDGVLLALMDQF
ncbi:MAG: hypothetical protein ACK4LQ_12455 [Pararhodobacter sp.]